MADEQTLDLVVPALGESITEAVIGQWLVAVGDAVDADAPVVDLETDKITVQLPAPAAGVLAEQRVATGDTVRVGDVVGRVTVGGAAAGKPAAAGSEPAAAGSAAADGEPAAAGPAAADSEPAADSRPAAAGGDAGADVDEDALRRLSPAQRRAVRMGHAPPPGAAQPASSAGDAASSPPRAPAARAQGDGDGGASERVVPMSPLRKRIAQRLVQAQDETASLTTFNEVDMSAIMDLRKRHQDAFVKAHGIKLGFMSLFAKACVAACQRFPGLNAEIRDDAIVYKQRYDFGIAVSTERGLVVPVLRGVDRMGLADIENGIAELAGKARDGKLTLDDLVGGTFTITNGGIFGSMLSTPLLNYPQTGILGMHNIVRRPVAIGDAVHIRPVMYIALTYDHRVVDGREAVQFLVAVKDRIEQPERLLLQV